MLADSMDATSNARLGLAADRTTPVTTWRKPAANKAYTDHNLRNISPTLRAQDEKELLAPASKARFEQRRYLLSERMFESTAEKIKKLVDESFSYRHMEYTYHDRSGEYFVKIIDDQTKEVIREIPPQKLLDIYASMKEIAGLLFDERR